jgi:histidine triad (HIT) family protein
MKENCVFCHIISGKFPSEKFYEDDDVLVVKDISPAAPSHVLILPKKHADNIMEADSATIQAVFAKIPLIAEKLGISKSGFRLVVNTGEDAGQSVHHMHVHLLGGREMEWPPG